MKVRHIAGFILLSAVVSSGAMAGTRSDAPVTSESVKVSYADLNLHSPAGAKALHQRVRMAANQVCGVNEGRAPIERVMERRACVAESMESALSNVDSTAIVTAYRS